jgi:hypothetical protein
VAHGQRQVELPHRCSNRLCLGVALDRLSGRGPHARLLPFYPALGCCLGVLREADIRRRLRGCVPHTRLLAHDATPRLALRILGEAHIDWRRRLCQPHSRLFALDPPLWRLICSTAQSACSVRGSRIRYPILLHQDAYYRGTKSLP